MPIVLSAQKKATEGWKAGVATINITPKEPMWMAGYASRTKPAEGKQHDLWVKALALEDATGKRSVMVSSDILGFTRDLSQTVKRALAASHDLSDADIILNGSHTHSGPVLSGALVDIYPYDTQEQQKIDNYTKWLESQVVLVVSKAIKNLKPAHVYAGIGVTRFQVNRRNNSAAELHKLSELKGPGDHALPVIKVVNAKGKVQALLFGYACHPTTLDGFEWSGDYPGYAQLELEKTYKGAVALFFQGAGGDQNPLPRRTVALAKQYGKELAAAVERVVEENNMRELDPVLKTAYREVDLPFSTLPSVADLEEVVRKDGGKTYFSRWAKRLSAQVQRGDALPASYPYPVQAWRIGDQLVFSLAGEVVVDYAVGLKNKHGWDAFVFAYNNDVMGYIPSVRVLTEGAYEGDSSQKVYGLPSKWAPAIESLIYGAFDDLVEELK